MLASGQWAYLAAGRPVPMDSWSRLIVGWQVDITMEEELVVTAFRRALLRRQPVSWAAFAALHRKV